MKYVIIGASAAGINCAKKLREIKKDAEILMISKDKHIVSRCQLHQYVEGERKLEDLNFANPADFFNAYQIDWKKGVEVTGIHPQEKMLTLSNGETVKYDKVLIATGASSFLPPIENLRQARGVVGLRNFEDAAYIKEMIPKIKHAVVLGAGLVGTDAVSGLLHQGVKLTLVEMGSRILPLQLDEYAASVYEALFRKNGVEIKLGVSAQKVLIDGQQNVKGLMLNTGEEIPCELIIVATGVRSNVGFLAESGIETDRFGLVINSKCETNLRDVYGAGDVTGRYPIWPYAVKTGMIAAYNMAGIEMHFTDYFSSKNTMNFLGLPTMSLGIPIKPDGSYHEVIEKRGRDYKKIIYKDGIVYGAIIQGDLSYVGVLTQMIKFKLDIEQINKPIFKIDYGDFFNVKQNQEFTY